MNKYDFSPKSELKAIHELPDPFLKPDGTRVQTREEWPEQREYLKAMLPITSMALCHRRRAIPAVK